MKLRNFLSWFASSVIAFIIMLLLINIVTTLFVDISMQQTLPIIIGSVYDYASLQAQNQTQVTFTSLCSGIDEALSLQKQVRIECTPEGKQQLASICSKLSTFSIEQQQQYQASCQLLTDGTLQKSCDQKIDTQISALTEGCKDFNNKKIDTRGFLIGPLAQLLYESIDKSINESLSETNFQSQSSKNNSNSSSLDNIATSQKINPSVLKYAVSYVQGKDKESYLAVKIISIILLFLLWFVVSHDLSDYLRSVSRMFFSTGMLVFAMWAISFILVVFYPPDTTSLLQIISGTGSGVQPPMSQLIALLPVIVLELTSEYVLLIAAASICIAFALYLLRRYYIDTHPSTSPS